MIQRVLSVLKPYMNLFPRCRIKTARGTYNNITIRGLGTTGGLSLVSVYLDEVPVTDQTEFAGDSQISGVLFDLERVEVLKGPPRHPLWRG